MPTLDPSHMIHEDSYWGESGFSKKKEFYCQKKDLNIGQTTDAY